MHSKSDNMGVMTYDNVNEIIEGFFDLLLPRYQISLEIQMRGSDFIFECINLLYFKFHKINLNAVVHIFILQVESKR